MSDPAPVPLVSWSRGRVTGQDAGAEQLHLHGSAVAVGAAGVLILGASGSGKSTLALQLISLGAQLISDDAVWVSAEGGTLALHRPDTSPDGIEARGIGLLRGGPITGSAPLAAVVDLDRSEPDRLPPRRLVAMGDATAELILGAGHPTLASALHHFLGHGRLVP